MWVRAIVIAAAVGLGFGVAQWRTHIGRPLNGDYIFVIVVIAVMAIVAGTVFYSAGRSRKT